MIHNPCEGDRDEAKTRKPYVKPEIRRVALRAEEAVLGSCKIAGVVGPGQPQCTTPSACSTPVS
jgi:hypothetical protein